MDQETIKALIVKSRNNDTHAFRKLVEIHQPFVYAVAFRLLCDNYETEEVNQETFIKVWKNLDRFNNDMRFTTWLYKIVVNLCYDKLKMKKRLKNRVISDSEVIGIIHAASPENPEEEFSNRDIASVILSLTAYLTPKQKTVFVLSEIEGLTTDEIITITGLSAKKIKSNLYCARQNIKEKLIRLEERRKP